jgi:hypothetical protein
MPHQGSLLVVAEGPQPKIMEALAESRAFPVIEVAPADLAAALSAAQPGAILLADHACATDTGIADLLAQKVTPAAPFIPVIARASDVHDIRYREALPVAAKIPPESLAARLAIAMRVRALHATVLRRAERASAEDKSLPFPAPNDPLADAVVLITGRGRSYPTLSTALGERVGVIGTLSIEAAAGYLKARDVDGLLIGDGFAPRLLHALVTVLCEDDRFRDLPIGMLGDLVPAAERGLPLLGRGEDVPQLIAATLPYVRLHAFEARLRRILNSLDAGGLVDPDTGLLHPQHFFGELDRAIGDARARSTGLCVARFIMAVPATLAARDAARLVSKLVRGMDFGCRDADSSILVAFTETDLREAHVVARRLAVALRRTMLDGAATAAPTVAVTALKSSDTRETLIGRITMPAVAAE